MKTTIRLCFLIICVVAEVLSNKGQSLEETINEGSKNYERQNNDGSLIQNDDDTVHEENNNDTLRINDVAISKQQTVMKLSKRIKAIIEHYQQDNPVGLPETNIPDPMIVPSTTKSSLTFDNMQVHGLSKFQITKVYSDLAGMEIVMGILISKLELLGNYTLRNWISQSQGPFNVSLLNVYIEGKATLIVNDMGKLEADNVKLDGKVEDIKLDFQNLSALASMVQSLLNTAGSFLFDTIKPQMLQEFNHKLLKTMNDNLKTVNVTFKNTELPIDSMIRSVRNLIQDRKMDPYHIDINNIVLNNSLLHIDEFSIYGLSNFYRVGDIKFNMENKTLQFSLHIGIPLLKGRIEWEVSYITKQQTCFQLKYIQLIISVNQTINLNKSPQLNNIDVKIGQIKFTKTYNSHSYYKHILDYYFYNILPNIIRVQVLYLIKNPLYYYIQNTLDNIKLNQYLTEITEL